MRTAAHALPQAFAGLDRLHPLHAIRSERRYETAHALVRRLMLLPDRTQGRLDHIERPRSVRRYYKDSQRRPGG